MKKLEEASGIDTNVDSLVKHWILSSYLVFYSCFQVDTSNERISLGLKESYFPETEKFVGPVSEEVGMEVTNKQETNMTSVDDAEESQDEDEDDKDEENLELRGAQSDNGK